MNFEMDRNRLVKVVAKAEEKEVTLPQNVRVVGKNAFKNTQIERVIIPDGVDTIEGEAFAYSQIKYVKIPASVEYIGESIFDGCEGQIQVEISSQTTGMVSTSFVRRDGLPPVQYKVNNDYHHLSSFAKCPLYTITGNDGWLIDGEVINARNYTPSEYAQIKLQASEYELIFEHYSNRYEYDNRERREYRSTNKYSFPLIPDNNILVKDGRFYGCIFPRKGNIMRGVLLPLDGKQPVYTANDSYNSEWGHYIVMEKATLVRREPIGGWQELIAGSEERLVDVTKL